MAVSTLNARIHARFMRIYRDGIQRTLVDLFGWSFQLVVGIVLSPIALILHFAGFRQLTFITSRIGHLAIEPDCFLKAYALGELPKRRWFFFLAPYGKVANEHLLSYWTPHIQTVRNPIACRILASLSMFGLMRYDTGRYALWLDHSQDVYRLNTRWNGREPLLTLTQEDEAWGSEMLKALGVPSGRWFVCIQVREPGFYPGDEDTHAHRNASPEKLLPAVAEIVARGGWCVRMGHSTDHKLPPVTGLIDYTAHPLRSARLDVLLCAKAKFFLGNTSGLALVSSVFGRPSILVNMVPLAVLSVLPQDMSVCKLYRRQHDGRLLRFREIFGTPAANFRYAAQYQRAGIDVQENSADEIREAVVEFLDRLEGCVASEEDRILQDQFLEMLQPGDYSFGASSCVAASFLRRHQLLLE